MMKTCNIGPRVKKNVTSWCANLSDHLINLSVAKKRQVQVVFLGKGWGLVWSGLVWVQDGAQLPDLGSSGLLAAPSLSSNIV